MKFEQFCPKNEPEKKLQHILTFMVRGIYTKLQFAFGFFPTTNAKSHELFPIVWEAVSVLESIGLHVRCFVRDGASANRSFYEMHSKDGGLPLFAINLCNTSSKIYLICDVPHLIKTVKNNWENSHGNKNTRNLQVSFPCSINC